MLILVLVGGNQPVQTIVQKGGEILGAQGTNFPNGLQTDYVTYPNVSNSTVGLLSNSTIRRCEIASGSDTCDLINYSSVDWLARPRIWLTGLGTNTTSIFFVSTSTVARSGSWWNGIGTSTLPHAPIKLSISTTSAPFFQNIENASGTTTAPDSQVGGTYPGGLFLIRKGDRAICGVTIGDRRAGDLGFWATPTSTDFTMRGNCALEIIATSTPDTTSER